MYVIQIILCNLCYIHIKYIYYSRHTYILIHPRAWNSGKNEEIYKVPWVYFLFLHVKPNQSPSQGKSLWSDYGHKTIVGEEPKCILRLGPQDFRAKEPKVFWSRNMPRRCVPGGPWMWPQDVSSQQDVWPNEPCCVMSVNRKGRRCNGSAPWIVCVFSTCILRGGRDDSAVRSTCYSTKDPSESSASTWTDSWLCNSSFGWSDGCSLLAPTSTRHACGTYIHSALLHILKFFK